MSEEHRYSEAEESDDELPLPQGFRVHELVHCDIK
jgi:hypothetical protein